MAAVESGIVVLPTWALVVLIAFLAAGAVLAVSRRGLDYRAEAWLPIGLVLIAVVIGSLALDQRPAPEATSSGPSFDSRALELSSQAMMPGSALGCLDAIAGETVETSCEKAVFASPEATAAAVSYVAAQLTLLAYGSKQPADQRSEPVLSRLRRALEADRFGIVAHVLAVRDGCRADRCKALALLHHPSRVIANLAEATYDGHVNRYKTAWPATPSRPLAAIDAPPAAPAPESPPVASAKPPSDLFFPSAASIPPVNIMTSEPSAPPQPHDATGAVEAKPAAARKPQQARQPPAPATRPGAPMQLGPAQ